MIEIYSNRDIIISRTLVMAFFLILIAVVVIFVFRKKISLWLEHLEGPIGRFWRRGNPPPREEHLQQTQYQYNRVVINPTAYQYQQQQQYPETYSYPQYTQANPQFSQPNYQYPQNQYSQGYQASYAVTTSQASMDDEHRAQANTQYGSVARSGAPVHPEDNNHGVNPYIR